MALLQTDGESATSLTTSVFDEGSYSLTTITVDASSSSSSESSLPPKPVLIVTPTMKGTYPVVLFLPGFILRNSSYQQLLNHISSHGFVLVAPQLYELPLTPGQDEINNAAEVINWLENGLQPHLPDNVEPDFTNFALTGHSRGGKGAFAIALGLTEPAIFPQVSALIGIDPVAGNTQMQTTPHILTGVPRSFDMPTPVAVVGAGLGPERRNIFTPPCAPKGWNHEEFFKESKPPCAHFVAKEYGHMDMLDDDILDLLCKEGSGPRDSMRRATGGVSVAFLRAYLCGDRSDLEAIVGDPSLSPAKLEPVKFVPS